ncbi:hypothetical protein O3G_MSEX008897 [Manduca sexta]|uniref:Uncharacterized protein n=1 Tax=Manduca sexta TaxID=7130 RepID=A0A921ZBX4_MANSE|nr:hypothetical protein O3G_MSEX008897 [Manduca sexta]
MPRYSENYYLRKCFLEREQVPTQSVMIKKMSPPLAKVYFKSMTPKLKVLAGLEPPMKGGGNDWYIPPKVILEEGRVVLKPLKKEYLSKLGCEGIGHFGDRLLQIHNQRMEEEKKRVLQESDIKWKKHIEASCRQQWEDASKEAAKNNTEAIQQAFREFTILYTTSITRVEQIMFDAAVLQIKREREKTFQDMQDKFKMLIKKQATRLYDKYEDKLKKQKAKLKAQFIKNVEESRTAMGNKVHDLNVEKHTVVEKLRNLLQCQNLACQVYVALKEREECQKEIDLSKYEHQKKMKALTDEIATKDFEIRLAKEKERKRIEFINIWQRKVCQVVKKFQMFVGFCLKTLPEHAEFFINMEKLMLLQLNDVVSNPEAESIFEPEQPVIHTPIPRPHPFFLFCDKGVKTQVDDHLCPKHCTSSASQLPVIVVNKRCIYAACDNFDQFSDKVRAYIDGHRGDDKDFEDTHCYEHDVPVKYTTSLQRLELQMQSSLLQILQDELPNVRQLPVECCLCRIPHCFCSPTRASEMSTEKNKEPEVPPLPSVSSGYKIESRSGELAHERQPKWESYFEYVHPTKCKCGKTAKKHLRENLPPYMWQMSKYDEPQLPNYEMCSLHTLRKLVKKAQGKRTPPPEPAKVESKTKDVGTQYSDQEFDLLCTCFSDEEVEQLHRELMAGTKPFDPKSTGNQCEIVDGSVSPSYFTQRTDSFVTARAYSLRNLIDNSPQLEEIFVKPDCKFN